MGLQMDFFIFSFTPPTFFCLRYRKHHVGGGGAARGSLADYAILFSSTLKHGLMVPKIRFGGKIIVWSNVNGFL